MFCLSSFMFIAAIRMLRAASYLSERTANKKEVKTGLLLLGGLLTGLIMGLLGIGGGFLMVPALYFWARLPMKKAIGTTLLIITINSLFGFFTNYAAAVIDWHLLLKFSAGSILGILIGTKLSAMISANCLKKIFGWFVLFTSFYIVYKQLDL